jgi:Tfp pilus assembly protein PilX
MRNHTPPPTQQGVALIVVMVIMLLSSLLVLGGSRVAVLNEFLAGSEAINSAHSRRRKCF